MGTAWRKAAACPGTSVSNASGFSPAPAPVSSCAPSSGWVTIPRLFRRIAEAASYQGCPLSAASPLISLEVSPLPALSQNLSGAPLVTVRLQHTLVSPARPSHARLRLGFTLSDVWGPCDLQGVGAHMAVFLSPELLFGDRV